ncbi:hypothetical protein OROHE_021897 [Orobanche hederae]
MHSHAQKNKAQKNVMRRMYPNFDQEDALETVLEVPILEEMFSGLGNTVALRWQNMATWIKAQTPDKWSEASTAQYIVQQYIAATGGQPALNAVNSVCVIGQVKISASEFHQGDENVKVRNSEEPGGFVLWQKNLDIEFYKMDSSTLQ